MGEALVSRRGGGSGKEVKITSAYSNSDGKSYFSISFRQADIAGFRLCAVVNFKWASNIETCCIIAKYPCASTSDVVSTLHRKDSTSISQFGPSSVTVANGYVKIEFLYGYVSQPFEFLDVAAIKIQ